MKFIGVSALIMDSMFWFIRTRIIRGLDKFISSDVYLFN